MRRETRSTQSSGRSSVLSVWLLSADVHSIVADGAYLPTHRRWEVIDRLGSDQSSLFLSVEKETEEERIMAAIKRQHIILVSSSGSSAQWTRR